MVTIHLPETMETLMKQVAGASGASHEEILLTWLSQPLAHPGPETLEAFLASLESYSSLNLWTLVYRQLPTEQEQRYQELMEKAEIRGNLSSEEQTDLEHIIELTNLNVAIRGEALVLLKERGENIDYFLKRKRD
jgi:hypothetical protein